MALTALHRILGIESGEITDEMISSAIAQGIRETDDLDWKSELPPERNLNQTDFPKDIAAMANSGGGVIVYGITEDEKTATGRKNTGKLSENHERTLRAAAYSAISPPVFGLEIETVGDEGNQVVAIVVPPSLDVPHLVFRGDLFGAPMRNNADTIWMREDLIAAKYRSRFDDQRNAIAALQELYDAQVASHETVDRAWLFAVARPRIPRVGITKLSRKTAVEVFDTAHDISHTLASQKAVHPLDALTHSNPRTGLRSWIMRTDIPNQSYRWREAWAAIHTDGSVGLAAAIGGAPKGHEAGNRGGNEILVQSIEGAVVDFMALIRSVSQKFDLTDFEIIIGIEYDGSEPLTIGRDDYYWQPEWSTPLRRYARITATVVSNADDEKYTEQVGEIVLDCLNQGGVSNTYSLVTNVETPIR